MNIGSTMGSAFTAGATAVAQGVQQSTRAAQEVVDATTSRPVESTTKLVDPMINMQRSEHLVAAGSKVIQAADEQLGTLINIKA